MHSSRSTSCRAPFATSSTVPRFPNRRPPCARVRTASGISELRTFWVGALPVDEEKEPNSEIATAQKVPLNVNVVGRHDPFEVKLSPAIECELKVVGYASVAGLSIIDVQGGHQPVANETREVWTVLNGEIYNFAELRCTLEKRGHRFSTRSDTEVVTHAYEEFGDA